MSPEQVRGQRLDGRSDIFSAGAVFYEAMTGRQAFTAENAPAMLSAILTREPLPLMRFVTDAPQELQRIITKALRKEREERYQTAKDLLADLKTLREELEFHAKLEASVQPNARSEGAPVASAKIITEQRTHSEPGQLGSERVTPQVQIVGQRENHFEADAATEDEKIRGKLLNSRRWLTVPVVAALVTAAVVYALYFHRGFATRPPEIKSLAVLPPRPLQPTVRDEALEMGTASALITRIGSLRQLIVRPESAVEIYARPDQDPLAAGREQKVDAVLDSRYQRSGEKVRFTLRLLRVADGATLWSDTLDQQAADLFAIEDALSGKVTGALRLTLSSAEKELLAKRYTNSAEAWQRYVRGRHLLHQRRIPDVEKAITYFEQAIALDQEFALAHVMLGVSYTSLNWLGLFPAKEVMPKAKAAYDQALKVDDQLAEAHNYLAVYKDTYERDFKGAEQEYKLAIDLNPNSADVRHSYAFHLTYMGRFDQAIRRSKEQKSLILLLSGSAGTSRRYFISRAVMTKRSSRRAGWLTRTRTPRLLTTGWTWLI